MSSSKFTNLLICINASIPLVILGLDYWNDNLGANAVNNAIHITGIVSLVLLLLSLAITPAIRLTGQKHWFVLRKTFGLFGFFYAIVHLTIYFFLDREADVSSLLYEMSTRRFLLIGTLAIVLLLPLVLTSTQKMRQRLGIKNWKRLHRLAYMIAVLVVLHYYMQVKSDTRLPLAFAAVLGIILASRIPYLRNNTNLSGDLRKRSDPDVNSKWSGELVLIQTKDESHNVKSFRLARGDRNVIPFRFAAGQFITLTLTTGSETIKRSYTIASSPLQSEWIEISVKKESGGLASAHLHENAHVGDTFHVSGPHGKFCFTPELTQRVVLVAGGVGITPIMSILRYMRDINWLGEARVLLSAKTEADLLFRKELVKISDAHKNISVESTLTQNKNPDWVGSTGRVGFEQIEKMKVHQEGTHVFVCGPNAMADELCTMVRESGIDPKNLHRESFGGKRSRSAQTNATTQDTHTVEFSKSKRIADISDNTTLLELAEKCGVRIESDCRAGVCGQCIVRLLSGQVDMDCEDALSDKDKENNMILACQATVRSDLIIET